MIFNESVVGIKVKKNSVITEHKGIRFKKNSVITTVWEAIKDIVKMLGDVSKWSTYVDGFAEVSSWGVNPLNIYVDSTATSSEGYAGIESAEYVDLTKYSLLTIDIASALMNYREKIYAPEIQFIDTSGNVVKTLNLANNSTANWTNTGGTQWTRQNFTYDADISDLTGSYRVRLRMGNIGYGQIGSPKTVHVSINSMILT